MIKNIKSFIRFFLPIYMIGFFVLGTPALVQAQPSHSSSAAPLAQTLQSPIDTSSVNFQVTDPCFSSTAAGIRSPKDFGNRLSNCSDVEQASVALRLLPGFRWQRISEFYIPEENGENPVSAAIGSSKRAIAEILFGASAWIFSIIGYIIQLLVMTENNFVVLSRLMNIFTAYMAQELLGVEIQNGSIVASSNTIPILSAILTVTGMVVLYNFARFRWSRAMTTFIRMIVATSLLYGMGSASLIDEGVTWGAENPGLSQGDFLGSDITRRGDSNPSRLNKENYQFLSSSWTFLTLNDSFAQPITAFSSNILTSITSFIDGIEGSGGGNCGAYTKALEDEFRRTGFYNGGGTTNTGQGIDLIAGGPEVLVAWSNAVESMYVKPWAGAQFGANQSKSNAYCQLAETVTGVAPEERAYFLREAGLMTSLVGSPTTNGMAIDASGRLLGKSHDGNTAEENAYEMLQRNLGPFENDFSVRKSLIFWMACTWSGGIGDVQPEWERVIVATEDGDEPWHLLGSWNLAGKGESISDWADYGSDRMDTSLVGSATSICDITTAEGFGENDSGEFDFKEDGGTFGLFGGSTAIEKFQKSYSNNITTVSGNPALDAYRNINGAQDIEMIIAGIQALILAILMLVLLGPIVIGGLVGKLIATVIFSVIILLIFLMIFPSRKISSEVRRILTGGLFGLLASALFTTALAISLLFATIFRTILIVIPDDTNIFLDGVVTIISYGGAFYLTRNVLSRFSGKGMASAAGTIGMASGLSTLGFSADSWSQKAKRAAAQTGGLIGAGITAGANALNRIPELSPSGSTGTGVVPEANPSNLPNPSPTGGPGGPPPEGTPGGGPSGPKGDPNNPAGGRSSTPDTKGAPDTKTGDPKPGEPNPGTPSTKPDAPKTPEIVPAAASGKPGSGAAAAAAGAAAGAVVASGANAQGGSGPENVANDASAPATKDANTEGKAIDADGKPIEAEGSDAKGNVVSLDDKRNQNAAKASEASESILGGAKVATAGAGAAAAGGIIPPGSTKASTPTDSNKVTPSADSNKVSPSASSDKPTSGSPANSEADKEAKKAPAYASGDTSTGTASSNRAPQAKASASTATGLVIPGAASEIIPGALSAADVSAPVAGALGAAAGSALAGANNEEGATEGTTEGATEGTTEGALSEESASDETPTQVESDEEVASEVTEVSSETLEEGVQETNSEPITDEPSSSKANKEGDTPVVAINTSEATTNSSGEVPTLGEAAAVAGAAVGADALINSDDEVDTEDEESSEEIEEAEDTEGEEEEEGSEEGEESEDEEAEETEGEESEGEEGSDEKENSEEAVNPQKKPESIPERGKDDPEKKKKPVWITGPKSVGRKAAYVTAAYSIMAPVAAPIGIAAAAGLAVAKRTKPYEDLFKDQNYINKARHLTDRAASSRVGQAVGGSRIAQSETIGIPATLGAIGAFTGRGSDLRPLDDDLAVAEAIEQLNVNPDGELELPSEEAEPTNQPEVSEEAPTQPVSDSSEPAPAAKEPEPKEDYRDADTESMQSTIKQISDSDMEILSSLPPARDAGPVVADTAYAPEPVPVDDTPSVFENNGFIVPVSALPENDELYSEYPRNTEFDSSEESSFENYSSELPSERPSEAIQYEDIKLIPGIAMNSAQLITPVEQTRAPVLDSQDLVPNGLTETHASVSAIVDGSSTPMTPIFLGIANNPATGESQLVPVVRSESDSEEAYYSDSVFDNPSAMPDGSFLPIDSYRQLDQQDVLPDSYLSQEDIQYAPIDSDNPILNGNVFVPEDVVMQDQFESPSLSQIYARRDEIPSEEFIQNIVQDQGLSDNVAETIRDIYSGSQSGESSLGDDFVRLLPISIVEGTQDPQVRERVNHHIEDSFGTEVVEELRALDGSEWADAVTYMTWVDDAVERAPFDLVDPPSYIKDIQALLPESLDIEKLTQGRDSLVRQDHSRMITGEVSDSKLKLDDISEDKALNSIFGRGKTPDDSVFESLNSEIADNIRNMKNRLRKKAS